MQPVFTEPFSLSDHEILEQGRQKTRDDAHRAELRVCGTVEANPYMALKPADRLPSFESQRVLGPSIIAHAGSSKYCYPFPEAQGTLPSPFLLTLGPVSAEAML